MKELLKKLERKHWIAIGLSAALVVVLAVVLVIVFACGSCEHTNLTATVIKSATCLEEGSQQLTCKDCGKDMGTHVLEKDAHKYVEQDSSVAATCTAPGKDVFKCSVCDNSYEIAVAQLDHKFSVVADETTLATCTTAGLTTEKCTDCDAVSVEYVAALGHTWELKEAKNGIKAGDCVARKCTVCDEEAEATALHNYKVTSDTATCTANGEKTFTCTGCNDSYTDVSSAKGHNVEEWNNDDSFNSTLVENTTCTYTYQHKGICKNENCGIEVTEQYEADNHNYKLVVKTPATCVTTGIKVMQCQCGETLPGGKEITYYAEHTYGEAVSGVSTCTACGENRKKVDSNETTLGKNELAQEVELQSGAVIRLPDTVAGQVSENATLGANNLTKGDVPAGTPGLDRVGDGDTIYNITLTEGDNPITNFRSDVTVKLPYTLGADEDPANVTIFYLGSEGLELIDAVFTPNAPDSNEGFVTFTTNHFSYYLVGLYKDSELCARFGHNYLISSKPASCTESGYYIETCRRCGEYGRRDFYSATGHTATPDTAKTDTPATCITNGIANYKCAVCAYEYTVTTIAAGHKFVASSETPASCTAAGAKVETCSVCQASHSITLPQLKHNITSTVVVPTCSEGGYTTNKCSACEYGYTTDYKAATGHTWNIAEATCAHGQVCLVCSKAGAPATGNHNMSGGRCTVCGYGCTHEDTVKEAVAPKCTEGGYTVYVCSKCNREEKRDYTLPAGHAYPNNFGACTVCGADNANIATAVENLLSSLASEGYTLRLEDIKINFKQTTTVGDEDPINDVEGNVTLDLGELYFVVEGEVVKLYLNGAMTVVTDGDSETASITAYGDGKHIYIKMSAPGYDDEPVIRFNYDEALNYAMSAIMGGGSSGGNNSVGGPSGGNNVSAVSVDINGDEVAADKTIGEMIDEMLESIVTNPLVTPWIALLQEKTPEMSEAYAKLLLSFFVTEKVEAGYKYSMDFEKIQQFNKDLKELTIAQIIDKEYGEGKFNEIFAYLESLATKKITDFVTEILAFADESGIPSELIITTINGVMSSNMPPEAGAFDILAYLNGQFAEMTIADLYAMLTAESAEAPSFAEIIAEIKKAAAEKPVYEHIPEEQREVMFSAYNAFLDKSVVHFYFITDKDGKLVSINSGYDNFKWNETVYEENGVKENVEFNINMGMSLAFAATIPENADAIKKEFDAIAAKLELSIIGAFEAAADNTPDDNDGGNAEPDYLKPIELGMFEVVTADDGTKTIYVLTPSSESDYVKTAFADLAMLGFIDDCKDTYSVGMMAGFANGRTTSFYFNSVTNELSYNSPHLYDTPYEGTYPEGYYKTYDDAPCGERYGELFVCDKCGKFAQDNYDYKEHMYYETVELLEDSCEGKVLVTSKCYHEGCDYTSVWVRDNAGYDNEHSYNEEYVEIPTNHAEETGKTYIMVSECPCGHSKSIALPGYDYHYENDGGCEFNDSIYVGEGDNYYIYVTFCAINTCDIAIVRKVYNSVAVGTTCQRVTNTEYKVVKIPAGDEEKAEYGTLEYWNTLPAIEGMTFVGNSHRYSHNTITVTEKSTDKHYVYYRVCSNCTYEEYDEEKRDELGRLIYDYEWTLYNGKYVHFHESERRFKSLNSCEYDYYARYESTDKIEYQYTSTEHYMSSNAVADHTCTQPEVAKDVCRFCGEANERYSFWWYWHNYNSNTGYYFGGGHRWIPTDSDPEFAYECENCGLKSNKGDGHLSLEDLTNNFDYSVEDSIVIGYNGTYINNVAFKFSFIKADENYGDLEATVIPVSDYVLGFEWNNSFYEQYYHDGELHFGTFSLTTTGLREAAAEILAVTGLSSVEEVLEQYDLAIQMDDRDFNINVGDGVDGVYTVLVLENLLSYFR